MLSDKQIAELLEEYMNDDAQGAFERLVRKVEKMVEKSLDDLMKAELDEGQLSPETREAIQNAEDGEVVFLKKDETLEMVRAEDED